MANSKLNQYTKSERKILLAEFIAAGGKLFNFNGFTVAIKPAFSGSNMALVSTSSASPDEEKMRRKVGEFHALEKMQYSEVIQVPLKPEHFEDFANTLGEFFLGYS